MRDGEGGLGRSKGSEGTLTPGGSGFLAREMRPAGKGLRNKG